MRAARLYPLIIVVAGIAAWANGLNGPFIFDDDLAVVANEQIRTLWPPWRSMQAAPSTPTAGRPVSGFTFAVNYALGGLDVRGYHALNIAIHLCCGLVLYGIVRRTLAGSPAVAPRFAEAAGGLALATALIWTVHPLQTEAVSYVTQRTETLAALFYLLAIYAAIRAAAWGRPGASGAWGGWWCAAAVACCALGMGSKEVVVTAPLLVVLYDRAYAGESMRELWRRRRPLYLGLAATWLVLAGLMLLGPRSNTVGYAHDVGALDYLLNQGIVITRYLRLVFWPAPLVIDYGVPVPVAWSKAAAPAALVAVLLAAAVAAYLRRPAAGFPGVWFFAVLAPTSSFVPIATEVAAERRMYLPLAGIVVLLVVGAWWALSAAVPAARARRVVAAACLAAVACAGAWGTHRRNVEYADPVRIWFTAAEAVRGNPRAQFNLALAYQEAGRLDDAVDRFERAITLYRDNPAAHTHIGSILASQGDVSDSVWHFREAIRLDPGYARAYVGLGDVFRMQSGFKQAAEQYRLALDLDPDLPRAHLGLGLIAARNGDFEAARAELLEAARLAPDATRILREAAWVLATHPQAGPADFRESVRIAEQAAAGRGGRSIRVLDALAAAYAADGDFDRAVATAERAAALADEVGAVTMADAIRGRRDLYRQGRRNVSGR